MWDLVGNPEDRFSHNEAQILIDIQLADGSVSHGDCNVFGNCDISLGLECKYSKNNIGGIPTCQCKVSGEDQIGRCKTKVLNGEFFIVKHSRQ